MPLHKETKPNIFIELYLISYIKDERNMGCLNIHRTHVTVNNSTNKNAVFIFVSDLKIVYYNNY